MLRGLSALCAALLAVVPTFAQDGGTISQTQNPSPNPSQGQAADQLFSFYVKLRLISKDEAPRDVGEQSKVTLSGQPIGIKLDGKNMRGLVVFTVYSEKDKPRYLLAQAELLVQEEPGKGGQYVTSLKAIPFTLGEAIEFYPLGKDNPGTMNIMMILRVDAYQSIPGKSDEQSAPQNTPALKSGGQ